MQRIHAAGGAVALALALAAGSGWIGSIGAQEQTVPPAAGPAAGPGEEKSRVSLKGRVAEILKNGHGDAHGFQLDDGSVVRFPPHNGAAVAERVRVGSDVSVLGERRVDREGRPVVEAERIDVGGETVKIDRPAPPKGGPKAKKDESPMNAAGAIAEFHKNPHGDVDGFALADGTEVKTPPHRGESLAELFKPGDRVKIDGRKHVTPKGDVHLHADRVAGDGNERVWERGDEPGPKPGRGPKHGPGKPRPGDRDDGPSNAEIMRELKEIRRLLEESRAK